MRTAVSPRRWVVCLAAALLLPAPAAAQPPLRLNELTLEQLLEIEVTSVSRKAQPLVSTPAALFVITREDIRRSGLSSVPELLRLVPGVQVARYSNAKWSISARGMGVYYASKLLVLIDGRSVFTPDFAGVYWDLQEVPLDSIERIEVVRGPGGTMWGANAVNGVINIITREAADTPGARVSVRTGNADRAVASFRFGGAIGERTAYRVYARATDRQNDAGDGADDWSKFVRSGFRLDRRGQSSWTVQGDLYHGSERFQLTQPSLRPPFFTVVGDDVDATGGNVVARWNRTLQHGDFTVRAYFDYAERNEYVHPYASKAVDVDVQHHARLGKRHDLVWGAEYRRTTSDIRNVVPTAHYDPPHSSRALGAAFVQDEIALSKTLSAVLGSKLEYHETVGPVAEPNTRVMWRPRVGQRVWAGMSRGVRTPALSDQIATFDYRVLPPSEASRGLPVKVVVAGNPQQNDREAVVAVEAGYRAQFSPTVAIDVAAFRNHYSSLTSYSRAAPVVAFDQGVPYLRVVSTHTKLGEGETHGMEALINWTPSTAWSLSSSLTLLDADLRMSDASVDAGDSLLVLLAHPRTQFTVRSSTQLTRAVDVDAMVFWNGPWQAGGVAGYWRTDLRAGWAIGHGLAIDVGVQNVFDDLHRETALYFYHTPTEIGRSGYARLEWRF